MKYFIGLILFLVIGYNTLIMYVDAHIDEKNHSNVYNDCHKVWSSRGIYDSKQYQNSLSSFKKAFELGHKGIEVDFYYDERMHKFILSHDRHLEGNEYKYSLKNGKLLTLETLFLQLGSDHYFWLDYKNLDRLSSVDTQRAIERLNAITKNSDIKDRIYLEGSTPNSLEIYTKAGYKTLFAFQPLKADSIIVSISSNIYKIAYYFYDITAIAMPYGPIDNPKYSEITQENLQGIPTFLFHVPTDEKLVKKLLKNDDVKVLLIGRDQSVNYADFTNCTKE